VRPDPEYSEDLGPISPESSHSFNFQHYLLTQMPGLFRQAAEDHLGRHIHAQETLTMAAIPTLIQESLQKAFDQWEAASGPGLFPASTQSPASFGPFANNGAAVASPSSPHPPSWSNGDIAQMSTNPYAPTAMECATSWPGISQSLEPMTLTSGEPTWLSPSTTTGFEPYHAYYLPTTGVSDAGFGSYIPSTDGNHNDPYTNHDTQMSGEGHGDAGYF